MISRYAGKQSDGGGFFFFFLLLFLCFILLEQERNKAVLVLVSVMIELLTASSALNRVVVVNAFRLIAPMIPERGVKDIVQSIIATENEDVTEEQADDDEDDDENNIDMDALEKALNIPDEDFEDIPAGEHLPDIP